MSLKAFKIGIGVAGAIVVAFAVAIGAVALRGEDTRNIIERSACAQNPSSQECQTIKREADRQRALRDTCIAFRQAMTRRAFIEDTRCPQQPRREVVPQTSETASQPSGRGPNAPGVPDDPPVTDSPPTTGKPPTTPPSPSPPSPPSPPKPSPPKPSPPPAPSPASPAKPVRITAPGVNVGVGNGGACVGVGGLNVNLGNC